MSTRVPLPLPLVFVAWMLCLAGCNSPSSDTWGGVSSGMTQAEVTDLLGEPSSRHAVPVDLRDTRQYVAWWQYGDRLSTLATSAVFSDLPDERVWVVYFDAEGRVVETREPTESPSGQ